jgi:hypothetical protein
MVLGRLLLMHIFCSFVFIHIGIAAGHHHPDIWHAGDPVNTGEKGLQSLDFGLFQLIAVGKKPTIDQSPALTVISFGQHVLHHLFPTVDHARLNELEGVLRQTCREFKVENLLDTPSNPADNEVTWGKKRIFSPWQGWLGMVQQVMHFLLEFHIICSHVCIKRHIPIYLFI